MHILEHIEEGFEYILFQHIESCHIHTGEILEHIFMFNIYYTRQVITICDISFTRAWLNYIRIEYGLKDINKYISYIKIKSVMLVINNFLKTENKFMCSECGCKCSLFTKTGILMYMLEHTE